MGDAAAGQVHRIEGVRVNGVMWPTTPFRQNNPVLQWMPDNRTLLVQTVPANRGRAPAEAQRSRRSARAGKSRQIRARPHL